MGLGISNRIRVRVRVRVRVRDRVRVKVRVRGGIVGKEGRGVRGFRGARCPDGHQPLSPERGPRQRAGCTRFVSSRGEGAEGAVRSVQRPCGRARHGHAVSAKNWGRIDFSRGEFA
eukprot:729631-Pyramimonas_sp.AAC.1